MHRRTAQAPTALAIVLGLLLALSGQTGASAETPGPARATTAAALPSGADAPTRVGRLARLAGVVSYHPDGADRWEPAMLNYPVSDGAAFWTEPGAEADLDIASTRIVMDGQTELDIDSIDALAVTVTLPQGLIFLRLRGLAPGESLTVITPRASILMRAEGKYAIHAGDMENPTRVTVLDGAAQVSGPNVGLDLGAGQTGLIEGVDDFSARLVPGTEASVQASAFLSAQLAREPPPAPRTPQEITAPPMASEPPTGPALQAAPAPPRSETPGTTQRRPPPGPRVTEPPASDPPPGVAGMPGAGELNAHGNWAETRQYGRVWFPSVPATWRPYRDGRWIWVRPWGWTWVDAAPWGFAPSHYGRWVRIGGRWAWAPGLRDGGGRPIYAPATVGFRDGGWYPLGWRDPYRPWYRASPSYLRALNGPRGGPVATSPGRPNIVLPPSVASPAPPTVPGPILFRTPGPPAAQPTTSPSLRPHPAQPRLRPGMAPRTPSG